MACATLKRHLDWEPVLGGRPSKRRRCNPLCPLTDACTPIHARGPRTSESNSAIFSNSTPSPFANVVCPKITPETMAENLRQEIQRLHRRKQIHYSETGGSNSEGNTSGGEQSSTTSSSSPTASRSVDKPLFTFKQVGLICERMIRERETLIREEYDQVLTAKLAEQYDAFVKFTYDQIHKRFDSTPSYLS